MIQRPPRSTLFPSTTLSRSDELRRPAFGAEPVERRLEAVHAHAVVVHLDLDDVGLVGAERRHGARVGRSLRSEEHTSELQSRQYLVCRLLLEKTKKPVLTSS